MYRGVLAVGDGFSGLDNRLAGRLLDGMGWEWGWYGMPWPTTIASDIEPGDWGAFCAMHTITERVLKSFHTWGWCKMHIKYFTHMGFFA